MLPTRTLSSWFFRYHVLGYIQHTIVRFNIYLNPFSCILRIPRYFAERGTWDPNLETFVDADGEVSQFSVSYSLRFSVLRCV